MTTARPFATPNYTCTSRSPMFPCSTITPSRSERFIFAVIKCGTLRHQLRFFHDAGIVDFEIRFAPAALSKRNKAGIWDLDLTCDPNGTINVICRHLSVREQCDFAFSVQEDFFDISCFNE